MPAFTYPRLRRTDRINESLASLAEAIEAHPSELHQMVAEVARRITDNEIIDLIPEHQMLGWLRIASVFRLNAKVDRKRASVAAAALEGLRNLAPKAASSLSARAELNWILDQTLAWLNLPLGGVLLTYFCCRPNRSLTAESSVSRDRTTAQRRLAVT